MNVVTDVEINSIDVCGDFTCKCGRKVDFQLDSSEVTLPECPDCGTEYRVWVEGDIEDPKVTVRKIDG